VGPSVGLKIGLVGKPNVGKSTLFAAATLAEAAIGNYPFTTIQANVGIGHVRVPDPGPELGVQSNPRHGKVAGTVRYVPIELVDVAGLVPGAHAGRGLGNQFLNDLSRADCLVHVVDASGATDAEGNVVDARTHDPARDIAFLEEELELWIHGILDDGWERLAKRVQQENRKLELAIADKLGGIGITEAIAVKALRATNLAGKRPAELTAIDLRLLAAELRRVSKPIVVALNKADLAKPADLARLAQAAGGLAIPIAAQAELALQKAAQAGAVEYNPGDAGFTVKGTLSEAQRKGLDYIHTHVLEPLGGTGVARVLEAAAFELLHLIPAFPVEDEGKMTDKDGRVLPDCHLVPRGTTARQLAYRVHTDLGEHFIRAIDCRTHRAIGADHELQAGDVVKVHAKA
jgi:ribosome-binding ATPase